MNYMNKCRTCLGEHKEMRHINTNIKICGSDVRLVDILKNFYDYNVILDHQYSTNICINCVHQLTMTYSFKILIESNFKKLQENCKYGDSYCDKNNDTYSDEDQSFSEKGTKQVSNKIFKNSCRKLTYKKVNKYFDHKNILVFCTECKAKFYSIKSLKEHYSNNHQLKSVVGRECDFCLEKFKDFRSLVLHRKQHLKPYLCENCWLGFYDIKELETHSCQRNTRHPGNNKTNEKVLCQCDQCGKPYPPGYIRIHMLTHSNERRYCCKLCPQKFKVLGGLHSHILWKHKKTRNYKCQECNATFVSSSSRSSHIRKNHLKEKKYACDTCSKLFFAKSELQRHTLTHTGVKNFHCHMCDKSYQTRYGLNVHLKSHSQQLSNMNILSL